jgi:hypothetical protein
METRDELNAEVHKVCRAVSELYTAQVDANKLLMKLIMLLESLTLTNYKPIS